MRKIIGLAIKAYHRSPLHHPLIAAPLSKLLHAVQPRGGQPFVHDCGAFKMHIDLAEHIDSKIYYTGAWDAPTVSSIRRLLKAGDTAVDVGANIGYLSLIMAAQVGASGKVFSFEASGWAFERLMANIRLNDI